MIDRPAQAGRYRHHRYRLAALFHHHHNNHRETHHMTTTETAVEAPVEVYPPTYTEGLGELVRAHRMYLGLSQRDLAARLGMDRRDYQHIETGRDKCPPGLISKLDALSDEFAEQVDKVIAEAIASGGITIAVSNSGEPQDEWDRLVAGRAAIETDAEAPITLTIVGKQTTGRFAR
ncbi:helix-turn-helix DNA binding domain protein [Mycobacterium phage Aelin]|uniref:Helix-turn-helix DNA binding domain protein n=9 Tax=Pegunavirus TaxID=1623295 RepID=A0A899IPD4_9CAUD|nr:HTH DNA binding protein [Mycobacterium phage Manad]YP_009168226.1 HTH DNA binding protein [Mycobacterium phage UncleHowie]AEK08798.1 helix-turn-helix DNA binding domain protein [Mycobacterium phage Harvey]AXH67563.1 helix-turn-helix DNA binding domain protein [Mycobacterium phage DonSanchon]AZF96711.1 helix-turn-helix DNA binding domain protein [Mycobacterium phage Keitherie]AZS12691.1 helix-turn-helix DNA binding domain protein [Mycobacterium phage Antonia]QBI99585.1 helix-turn-helix DNA 